MLQRKWLIGGAALALLGIAVLVRGLWTTDGVAARTQGQARPVPVEIATAQRKTVPVRIEALGSVTPIAAVAIKTQVDTTITGVRFRDGARIEKGDELFTLDCRQIEADMKRVEAVINGAQATFEQAQRDVERYTDLAARNATPIVTLNNAQTQVNISKATAESNRAQLENLKVQLGFCTIRAPISGRISMANVKVGNFVRQADTSPMATIVQTAPVYVSFTVPQKNLPDIRKAIAAETATVEAVIPGEEKRANGQVSMIENTIDAATGMAMIRATMPNTDELLWPGTLVTADMTLRSEEGVVVPSTAVQVSQTGHFVFIVKDGVAKVQRVTIDRQIGQETVIGSGLNGGETVVTDGQLLLSDGARVNPRPPKVAGS
ncbi:MAG TPA: efflux RND transporter periplasmic adaptor subunit [Pseudolabrys sp.]|jgi:RND family efflux transporter MFP subunit|nr:efflux RND transporter periplasmic adaptor subunit [Pseudolabrys sp.]